MKNLKWFLSIQLLFLCIFLVFNVQAQVSVTPTSIPQWFGSQTSQNEIDIAIASIIGSTVEELYKDNFGGVEEGDLQNSYETSYGDNGVNSATISYTGGNYVGGPEAYLLVKDGNDPRVPVPNAWYLFELIPGLNWDGKEDIVITGFWPNKNNAISHVALYGTQVSEPATMLLLGSGLLGLALVSRRMFRNK